MRWRRIALLGGIIVAVAAGAAGWYELRQAQIAREAQNWKSLGLAAGQNGDASRAVVLLGQYLRRMPSDAQAEAWLDSNNSGERGVATP